MATAQTSEARGLLCLKPLGAAASCCGGLRKLTSCCRGADLKQPWAMAVVMIGFVFVWGRMFLFFVFFQVDVEPVFCFFLFLGVLIPFFLLHSVLTLLQWLHRFPETIHPVPFGRYPGWGLVSGTMDRAFWGT